MTPLIPQTIDSIAALRRGERRIAIPGLKGSSPALFVAELVRAGLDNPLVIAATQEAAEEFCRELAFFSTGDLHAALFPAWDAAPFSAASPHPDVTGARLDTLFRLQNGLARITVMPVAAALQRVLPRKTLNDASCYLLAGEEFERDDLLARLVRMGYANVPLVEDRGTFAVRGGILDIFPPNLATPVRIEFFGDTAETIRAFDPLTQRSLQPVEELVLLPSRETPADGRGAGGHRAAPETGLRRPGHPGQPPPPDPGRSAECGLLPGGRIPPAAAASRSGNDLRLCPRLPR